MEMLLMSYLAGTESITKKYLSKMDSNKIVFIPTAGNVEPYTGYIDEGVEMLKSLGYELEIIDISKYASFNLFCAFSASLLRVVIL